jgi:uncharacterized Zn finger protein (UPF0148 family)
VTETPATEEEIAAEPESGSEPQSANCRHCGQPVPEGVAADSDWQCPKCERYQDSTICPTCHQLARISLMAAEAVPEPHAPARRRSKAKEGE